MDNRAHLYFHSPCFDGIISCAVTWDFLETVERWVIEGLHSVNYDARPNWLSTKLETPCAVVDFLYHPQAQFWADHHLTTFLNEEVKRDFQHRKTSWLIYNERSRSCATLLWNYLADTFNYRNYHYQEMVEWADKIDSAVYESVNEALFGDTPALRISAGLAGENRKEHAENLVKLLRHQALDQVARLPDVVMRFDKARSLKEAGLDRFAKRSRLEDDEIVVFDVDTSEVIINRYSPYYFFPQARYSAGILRSAKGATITAMRNPWREFPSAFLGKIFEKFGGGGHRRVGAIVLPEDRANEASAILEQIVREIRKEDSTLQMSATS